MEKCPESEAIELLRRIIKSTPHSMCLDAEAWLLAESLVKDTAKKPSECGECKSWQDMAEKFVGCDIMADEFEGTPHNPEAFGDYVQNLIDQINSKPDARSVREINTLLRQHNIVDVALAEALCLPQSESKQEATVCARCNGTGKWYCNNCKDFFPCPKCVKGKEIGDTR